MQVRRICGEKYGVDVSGQYLVGDVNDLTILEITDPGSQLDRKDSKGYEVAQYDNFVGMDKVWQRLVSMLYNSLCEEKKKSKGRG